MNTDEVLAVDQQNLVNWVITVNKGQFHTNTKLEDLLTKLDPEQFFKINRRQIVSRTIITSFERSTYGKILVHHTIDTKEELIVSKGRAAAFVKWLEKEV